MDRLESIAQAALNLYLVVNEDVLDEGVDELASLVASFVGDYGPTGEYIDRADMANVLHDVVAEYFDE